MGCESQKPPVMKISLLAPAHPYRGGIAAFTERLAHEMQKEGDEVKIETFTLQYPSFLFPGKTQYTDSPAPADLNIVRTINSCNPFNWVKVGLREAGSTRLAGVAILAPLHGSMHGNHCTHSTHEW